MWWSLPSWCRVLPVLGGTLLAPMALVSVSTPAMSNLAPNIAFAPTSPVGTESPISAVSPTTPLDPAYPTTPNATASTASTAPAPHVPEPSPSTKSAIGSPEPVDTVAVGSTTTTPPAATAVPQPQQNDNSGAPLRSGLSVLDSGSAEAGLADELSRRTVTNENSLREGKA